MRAQEPLVLDDFFFNMACVCLVTSSSTWENTENTQQPGVSVTCLQYVVPSYTTNYILHAPLRWPPDVGTVGSLGLLQCHLLTLCSEHQWHWISTLSLHPHTSSMTS
jgi:hypothetical protein